VNLGLIPKRSERRFTIGHVIDSIPRHHEEVVAVEIEVPGIDRRLLHDAQASVLGQHCYGFRRDEVMVLDPKRVLARERLPATRSLEVCRVQERMPARFEDAPDLLEVLPHQMEIEMHEHVKGEQEVDRVVPQREARPLEEDETGVALSGERDLRLLQHLLRDVQAVVLQHAGRHP